MIRQKLNVRVYVIEVFVTKLSVFSAIIEHTNQVIYLEDNDVACVSHGMLTIQRMCSNSADQIQSNVHEITTLKMQIQQIMKGCLIKFSMFGL